MADDNRHIFNLLFEAHTIDLRRSDLFDTAPGPMPKTLNFDRIEGMMLGLAIGDSLGNTSEGMLPEERRKVHGEIHDYLPNLHAHNRPVGLPSDDTQMAFWTLEQMIGDGRFDPEHLAARICRDQIFGIGSTVQEFIRNYRAGHPWYQCGPKSAGNGALMRIAPMLIPHLDTGTTNLWIDTALSAMITHNDSGSLAACLSFVYMLLHLLQMENAPEPNWWLETYVSIARDLEVNETYRSRSRAFADYEGPIWQFIEDKVGQAYCGKLSVAEACNQWYSGAYLLETVPSVLYILMRHGDGPNEAIVRAVNDTKDNDTIAAIVGAAVGALHGKAKIHERWISNLAGRTTDHDDGRIYELLAQARKLWWRG
jgi:ADP-ribosyl-[dinitrogen reductase] hydrolase